MIHRLLAAAAVPLAATALGGAAVCAAETKSSLAEPVRVEADGKPIDVEVGHAAPFFADFDGDGKPDLLVGQFGGGKLRIYPNQGDSAKPLFKDFTWLKAGADLGVVPAG